MAAILDYQEGGITQKAEKNQRKEVNTMELTPNQRKYYEAAYMVLFGIVEDEVLDDDTTYNILADAVKDIIEKQGLQNTLAIYVALLDNLHEKAREENAGNT